jgi:hypothetical protein
MSLSDYSFLLHAGDAPRKAKDNGAFGAGTPQRVLASRGVGCLPAGMMVSKYELMRGFPNYESGPLDPKVVIATY